MLVRRRIKKIQKVNSPPDPMIIGIDPGFDGAFAVLSSKGLELLPMPIVKLDKSKRRLDEREIVKWLWTRRSAHVFIEKVSAMPKQGVVSMFNFGVGWGILRGICAGMGIRYELAHPKTWQQVMMAGMAKGSEYIVASNLWPHISWKKTERCKINHEGLIDAALIAEYGRRAIGGLGCEK